MADTPLVIRDLLTQEWRVVCPVHGELARYRPKAFWTAARDARQHRQNCPLYEEPAGERLRATPPAG